MQEKQIEGRSAGQLDCMRKRRTRDAWCMGGAICMHYNIYYIIYIINIITVYEHERNTIPG